MLKACWDCIVGYDLIRDGARNDDSYGVQLNGNLNHSAPSWPPKQPNNKMYFLPKELARNDRITVILESSRRDTLTIGFLTDANGPDYNNIAFQLDLHFSQNELSVKIVENGNEEIVENEGDYKPADVINEDAFNIIFSVREDGEIFDLTIGGSIIYSIIPKHNYSSIRYLNVNGDVKVNALEFKFGN